MFSLAVWFAVALLLVGTATASPVHARKCEDALVPPRHEHVSQQQEQSFCAQASLRTDNGPLRLSPKPSSSSSSSSRRTKIVDAFIFNGEFDMLDVRLMSMWSAVDVFVLVESNRTFTDRPKPLFFAEQRHRYRHLLHKLRHYVFAMPASLGDTWARERAMRNALLDRAHALRGVSLREGDVVIVGDIDEVLDPAVLQYVRHCDGFPRERMCFRLRFSYYSYEFEKSNTWQFPQAIVVRNASTFPEIRAQELRENTTENCIAQSGWHCSYCFPQLSQFVHKLKSFSHTEFSGGNYTDEERILQRVVQGKDLFDRGEREDQRRVPVDAKNAPLYVLANRQCFTHMLNRTEWARQLERRKANVTL